MIDDDTKALIDEYMDTNWRKLAIDDRSKVEYMGKSQMEEQFAPDTDKVWDHFDQSPVRQTHLKGLSRDNFEEYLIDRGHPRTEYQGTRYRWSDLEDPDRDSTGESYIFLET